MGNEQALLGPCNAHITKATLLFKGCRVIQGAIAGEQALLETHQTDHRKFQTLAAVKRHQSHPIRGGVLAVGIAGEGGSRQETLEIPFLVLLLILKGGIHKLLEVPTPFLGFIGAIGNQLTDISALLHHLLDQLRRSHITTAGLQIVHQITELKQSPGRPTTQGSHRFGVAHHIPERNAQLVGRIGETLNRGLANPSFRHIDHPQEADGVRGIDQQTQISQQILDLPPVVEAQTSDNDVGDAPAHQ